MMDIFLRSRPVAALYVHVLHIGVQCAGSRGLPLLLRHVASEELRQFQLCARLALRCVGAAGRGFVIVFHSVPGMLTAQVCLPAPERERRLPQQVTPATHVGIAASG